MSSDTLQTIMVVGTFVFVAGVFLTIVQANMGHVWIAGMVGVVSLGALIATCWAALKEQSS